MYNRAKIKYRYLSFINPYFCLLFLSVHILDWLPHPKNTQCLLLDHMHIHIVCIIHIQPHTTYNTMQHMHLFLTYHAYINTQCATQHNTYTYTMYNTRHTSVFNVRHLKMHTHIPDLQRHKIHVPTQKRTCTTQSTTQWVCMSWYRNYIIHIHSITCTHIHICTFSQPKNQIIWCLHLTR